MGAIKKVCFVLFLLLFIVYHADFGFVRMASAQSFKAATIQSPNSASGTDQAATSLTLQSGRATGAGTGGDVVLKTPDVGSTGTTRQSLTTKVTLKADGKLGVGTTAPTAKVDINSDILRLRLRKTPASAAAPCYPGEIAWDANHIYICEDANSWVTAVTATWGE